MSSRFIRPASVILLAALLAGSPEAVSPEAEWSAGSIWASGRVIGMAEETEQAIRSSYVESVGRYGMLPVYARDVQPGTYEIAAETNSRFFTMHGMTLTAEAAAEDESGSREMYASFYIDSTSYTALYMGTAEEALEAGSEGETDRLIDGQVRDGRTWFTIPVEALDQAIDCAAYSKAKSRWYDRQILLDASSLPAEALLVELPDYDLIEAALTAYTQGEDADSKEAESETEKHTKVLVMGQVHEEEDAAEDASTLTEEVSEPLSTEEEQPFAVEVNLEDGNYSVEVVLTGGSGRASVSSPTYMAVREGRAYATLLWSSTHYDYMILDGVTYLNEAEDGGISRFTIPITKFEEPVDVIADTTAMGDPVEIAYTLTFYEASIGDRGLVPQEAAKRVLITALMIIVVGGVLNWFLKRKRR